MDTVVLRARALHKRIVLGIVSGIRPLKKSLFTDRQIIKDCPKNRLATHQKNSSDINYDYVNNLRFRP